MTNLKLIKAETTLLLPGPAGDLEVLLSAAPPESSKNAMALICHPHPLHGGTMHNKVVTTLSKAFLERQMQTVRFNFRGVGKSGGQYAEGIGELEDLFAVQAWIKETVPGVHLWLAGFSFGAYIAIRAAAKTAFAGLVTIAPPVNHFPLQEPLTITCPWVVVQGEQDEVVPTAEVLAWVETLDPPPVLIRFPNTGHFFHGKLTALKEVVVTELLRAAAA